MNFDRIDRAVEVAARLIFDEFAYVASDRGTTATRQAPMPKHEENWLRRWPN